MATRTEMDRRTMAKGEGRILANLEGDDFEALSCGELSSSKWIAMRRTRWSCSEQGEHALQVPIVMHLCVQERKSFGTPPPFPLPCLRGQCARRLRVDLQATTTSIRDIGCHQGGLVVQLPYSECPSSFAPT